MDLNKNRPRSLYWPSIIYLSFNFETLSHSIALRSELVVHGYPSLSWTWGALALSCLVCAGLWRLRFGVPKPGLGVPRSVLDMGLSDHRWSGQEMEYPGLSSTSGLPVLVWEDPGPRPGVSPTGSALWVGLGMGLGCRTYGEEVLRRVVHRGMIFGGGP